MAGEKWESKGEEREERRGGERRRGERKSEERKGGKGCERRGG